MIWEKMGLLFDPARFDEFSSYVGFAQSPQALVLDDRVRIYFSIRKRSANGKFISHIQYIETSRDFRQILDTSKGTVIAPGALGTYDEHGIFPMNVLAEKDRVLGYISGWSRRSSVSVDTGIGVVVSEDGGQTFRRIGDGPVLTASLHEPFLVGDPFVHVFDGVFHMWYIYGKRWERQHLGAEPERTYVIAHATSNDGFVWEKEGRDIIEAKSDAECQALPTVVEVNGRYHMFFCKRQSFNFRANTNRGYRIGYAWSDDLKNWTRDDQACGLEKSSAGWDSEMMCYPNAFKCNDQVYMLYNGNEFGRHGFGIARLRSDLQDFTVKIDTADPVQLHQYLLSCDEQFNPRLSTHVNLLNYAEKLHTKSVRFEMRQGQELVGLVAAYLNAQDRQTGFITHISVLSTYLRKGLARLLIERCMEHARAEGFAELRLEVLPGNSGALKLYKRLGFKSNGQTETGKIMSLSF